MKEIVGRIKLKNKVIVMDPCYDLKSDTTFGIGTTLDDVKSGEYVVEVSQEGKTVISLEVTHVDHYKEGANPLVDMVEQVGDIYVDSGQAGIYNYNYFNKVSNPKVNDSWYQEICKLTLSDRFGIKDDECVVSSSGYGDGEYEVYAGYSNDQVVYISIDFNIFEEDDYDWYEDEEGEKDEEDIEDELIESSKVKMKKYYVVYTDYNSEEFNVHGVCTRKSEGTKLFIEKLKDFLFAGPDDITYLRLIEVELEPEEVEFLKLNDGSDEIHELLSDNIWSRYCEELFVEGCDTIWTEIIPAYCLDRDLDPEDDDDYEAAQEILFDNDEAFSEYVDYYIEENYK